MIYLFVTLYFFDTSGVKHTIIYKKIRTQLSLYHALLLVE